jgi:hypothetical protein
MISFFAENTYLLTDKVRGDFLQRVSSRIRAEEISKYLGARLNPTEIHKSDVYIYVKPHSFDHIKDGSYVDVLDDTVGIKALKSRPGIKVLAMSGVHYEYLKKELARDIFLIPFHHINFERATRTRKEIKVCGYVGPPNPSHLFESESIQSLLERVGLKFEPLFHYQTRQDIINYYQKIDIQVIAYFNYNLYKSPYRHPTKIINAASFGIPTIATPTLGYKEVEGNYIPIKDFSYLREEAEKMKDKNYYNKWSEKVKLEAEKYHIEKIAKLYKLLK